MTFVQEARGYIAEQSVTGSPGSQRSMHWKLRVPVEQFESLVQKVVALGELERNSRTSQDVTEQFYDIEARIKNKKAEEKTLTKILDERTGKLEDVLKVETELSRVRGEIEQLEGKIRVLENLSSLATLTLSVRERRSRAAAADRGRFPTQVRGPGELDPGLSAWARRSSSGQWTGRSGSRSGRRRPAGLDHRPLAHPPPSPAHRPGHTPITPPRTAEVGPDSRRISNLDEIKPSHTRLRRTGRRLRSRDALARLSCCSEEDWSLTRDDDVARPRRPCYDIF